MGARPAKNSGHPSIPLGSGPVAQLVEQGTFNPKVAGSIPARPIASPRRWTSGMHRYTMQAALLARRGAGVAIIFEEGVGMVGRGLRVWSSLSGLVFVVLAVVGAALLFD